MHETIKALALVLISIFALFGLMAVSMEMSTMLRGVLIGILFIGIAGVATSYRVFKERL